VIPEKDAMTSRTFRPARLARAAIAALWLSGAAIGAANAANKAESEVEGDLAALIERSSHSLVQLATGGSDAASIQMAQDLAGVIDEGAKRRLVFTVGDGSVQNLADLKLLRGLDLAIVQSDALDAARDNKLVPGISSTTYIARLHTEELHLLARADIRGVEDLAGKTVDFGDGAAITGPAVLDLLHVKVSPVFDDPPAALAKLRSGEVAAFAYVAAKPTALFDGLGGGDGMHFLALPLQSIPAGTYVPGRLTAEDYPRLIPAGAPVATIAVPMAMVVTTLAPGNERYRAVEDFVDAFFTQLPRLQQAPHHPKWKEVDVAAELPGWKRFTAAELWLQRRTMAKVREEKKLFDTFLDTEAEHSGVPALSAQQKNRLFEQYVRWKPEAGDTHEAAMAGTSMPAATEPAQHQVWVATPPAVPPPLSSLRPPEKIRLPGGASLEMVPLPGGTFLMGSNDEASEKPVHRVAVAPFAIARFPVTRGQWKECVAATACADIAAGDDDAPITNVSWVDAQHFVAWLADATGQAYRLPSEAEWEYAARAGTETRYWWGNAVNRGMADCKGCGATYDPRHALKVGAFPPNPFGLHDMAGTVAEWVADCWHRTYRGAPESSAPWEDGDCTQHVLRGGSWQNDPSELRAASRGAYDSALRYVTHGFRPARSDQETAPMAAARKGGS
jgi:formylglycine-generating enzyme required for sulfatase activity/TRAP-type uncharacterized transport system substrate-binding protein